MSETVELSKERIDELLKAADGPPSNARTLARLMLLGVAIERVKR
jgi:uncharacterized protein (DUF1778 family)